MNFNIINCEKPGIDLSKDASPIAGKNAQGEESQNVDPNHKKPKPIIETEYLRTDIKLAEIPSPINAK